jgi:fluoroquinolone resistance protein
MKDVFIESRTFESADIAGTRIERGEYENCTFNACDFSNADFTGFKFIDCVFRQCNLSMVTLGKTVFRDVKFIQCKMLGLRFENCSEFGLSIGCEHSILNHSSFYGAKIKKTSFRSCQLQEVDFTNADLTASDFDNCDLTDATFEKTNLEKCDFSTALGFSIDPEINQMRKAKFSIEGLPGLLHKYNIEIE